MISKFLYMEIFYNTSGSVIEKFSECKECKVPTNCVDCGCEKKCDELCNKELNYNKSIKINKTKVNNFLNLLELENIEEFNERHNQIKNEISELKNKIDLEKKNTVPKNSNIKEIEEINQFNLKIKDLDQCKIIIEDLMLNFNFTDEEIDIKNLVSKNLRIKFNQFRAKYHTQLEKIRNKYIINNNETDTTKRGISNKVKQKKELSNKLFEELENIDIKIFEIRKKIAEKQKIINSKAKEAQELLDNREIKCKEKVCPTNYSRHIRISLVFQIIIMIAIVVNKINR